MGTAVVTVMDASTGDSDSTNISVVAQH